MKTGIKALVVFAAAFAAAAFFSVSGFCAEKMAAMVVFVDGDAQLKRAGLDAYTALKLNDSLSPGDSVKTGAGAKVSLVTKGGAEIRINENSNFSVPGKSQVREMYDLSVGQVWSRMLHRMAKLNVRTPSAVCAVRGTEADIEQTDIMKVMVYEGHVELENAAGKQALKAGEVSTVSGKAAPSAPRQMRSGEAGKWQEGINVKDIGKYLEQMGLSGSGGKKLNLKVDKNGKAKDVEIKLKKK